MVFGALKHYQVRGKKEELVTEMEKVVKQNKNQESLLSWDFRGKKNHRLLNGHLYQMLLRKFNYYDAHN